MPANPIFGGMGSPLGSWSSYRQSRGVPTNANPNLSQGEYNARLQSMGNPTGAQSYADYMASDDYAGGWRPGSSTASRPRNDFRSIFGGLLGGQWAQPIPTPTPTTPGNYNVPVQYNGIPNVIPVGANITDGTTATTPGTGGGTTTPPATTPPWWQTNPFPTTGSVQDIQAWIQQFLQNMGGQASSGGGGSGSPYGGGPARTPDPWGNTTTNPNNMSYPANYPGIPTGSYVGNPNNMSYIGAQSPTPAQNPTVVQEWANKRKGNGNNKRNR